MGSEFSRSVRGWQARHERRVLLVGLDGSGKTTVLFRMKDGKEPKTVPTIGYNVETIKVGKYRLSIWDVGGQDKLRPFWRHHYTGVQGIVFLIDSNDSERFSAAAHEVGLLLKEDQLAAAALLVLANKQDLPNAKSVDEIKSALGMTKEAVQERPCHVAPTVASSGDGLPEAMKWLCENMVRL